MIQFGQSFSALSATAFVSARASGGVAPPPPPPASNDGTLDFSGPNNAVPLIFGDDV